MLNRDILYNNSILPEMASAKLVGLCLKENLDIGDTINITNSDAAHDVDTGIAIPGAHYRITDGDDSVIHLVTYNTDTNTSGGKEYTVSLRDMGRLIASGVVLFEVQQSKSKHRVWKDYVDGVGDGANLSQDIFSKGYMELVQKPNGYKLKYRRSSKPLDKKDTKSRRTSNISELPIRRVKNP